MPAPRPHHARAMPAPLSCDPGGGGWRRRRRRRPSGAAGDQRGNGGAAGAAVWKKDRTNVKPGRNAWKLRFTLPQ
eukprot:gene22091-biopygen22213